MPLQQSEEERQVWQSSEQIERVISKSGLVFDDPGVANYLNGVMHRLHMQAGLHDDVQPRIKVVLVSSPCAFVFPNGAIYLCSGMLVLVENEAQVATILGHEIIHFTHRHMIRELEAKRSKEQIAMMVTIFTGFVAGPAARLWMLSAVSGYSRELEHEADIEGLKLMAAAGYDPAEAMKVFERLSQSVQKEEKEEPYFFASHPRLEERIASYRSILADRSMRQSGPARWPNDPEAYRKSIGPLILENAVRELQMGRYESALGGIEQYLTLYPRSAVGYLARGNYRRVTARDDSQLEPAVGDYREATRLDGNLPEAHKELGLVLRRLGRHEEARQAFKAYLRLAPTSVDAPIIRGYLTESTN